MRRLSRLVDQWREEGLISADQAERILSFEAARPSSHWVLRGVMGLAVVVIGIGVVSLVAANWEDIPDSIKLGAAFLLLAVLGFAALAMERRGSGIGTEILMVGFMFGCLATIGLINQVFHTYGHLDEALLFWCAITAPMVFMSRRRLVSSLWSWTLLGAVVVWILRMADDVFGWNGRDVFPPLLAGLPFVCYLAAVASGRLAGKANLDWSLRWAMIVIWFGAIVGFDIMLESRWIGDRPDMAELFIGAVGLAALALGVAWRLEEIPRYRLRLGTCAVAVFLLMGFLAGFADSSPFIGGALSVTLVGMAAVDLGLGKRRGLFQFMLAMVGVRFLVFYFQALGGLAMMGMGLIGSGLLILLAAWAWHRNRFRLQAWLEGMAP